MEDLNSKLKTKNDLYKYLKYKGKYISYFDANSFLMYIADVSLPEYGSCRLSFLQRILSEENEIIFNASIIPL